MTAIVRQRLHAHGLADEPFASALEAVGRLGAVQAQDYGGAKWALGQRTRGTTGRELDVLFDEGALLRTHVLRPTWQLVLPQDIRWLLQLTAPRVRAGLTTRYRSLEIDDVVAGRAGEVFVEALAGGPLTRSELGAALSSAGVPPDGQRLPHLLMHAELDGLIASGPRRGKQHTYAILDARAPGAAPMDRDQALAELTLRYFRSRGPAQLQDLVWWSGLTLRDARRGVSLAGRALGHRAIDGKEYWFGAEAEAGSDPAGLAHLLPNFDEYTVGYRDREALVHPDHPLDPTLFSFGSVLSNVVVLGGLVRGAWRRRPARGGAELEVRLLGHLQPPEAVALEAAADRLGRFLEQPVNLAQSVGVARSGRSYP